MEIANLDILLRLWIAHLLADFVFQSDTMASEKKKGAASIYFQWHIAIVGMSTYILLGQWTNIIGPLVITLLHALIDDTKARIERKWGSAWEMKLFLIDQGLHLITLTGYWAIVTGPGQVGIIFYDVLRREVFTDVEVLLVATAYLIVMRPIGFLIGFITKKWREEIAEDDRRKRQEKKESESPEKKQAGNNLGPEIPQETHKDLVKGKGLYSLGFTRWKWWKRRKEESPPKQKEEENTIGSLPSKGQKAKLPLQDSLKDAGRTIGMIERLLILTFILMQQYQAIGFLIAAKSVFRFGDLKESGQRKRTEYILIGTLMSFTFSILLGISTQFLINKL